MVGHSTGMQRCVIKNLVLRWHACVCLLQTRMHVGRPVRPVCVGAEGGGGGGSQGLRAT